MRLKCSSCGHILQAPDGTTAGLGKCPHCGERIDLAQAERVGLAPGDTLGDYRVDALVGSDAAGTLCQGTQLSLQRPVCIRVLPPELAGEPGSVERFKAQARALARLAHPNVLGVLSVGAEHGSCYLVSESVEGESLRARLARSGRLPLAEAVAVFDQVAAGLGHVHAEGLVHGNVRPESILFASDGVARLAHFAVTAAPRGPAVAPYEAPEQRASGAATVQADVYALGVVLYEMLTGQLPGAPWQPASQLVAEVPVAVDRVLSAALAASPESRFRTVAPLRDALRRAAQQPAPAGRAQGPRTRAATRRPGPRQRVSLVPVICGIGALLIALVVVVWHLATREAHRPTPPLAWPPATAVAPRTPTTPPPLSEAQQREQKAEGIYKLAARAVALGKLVNAAYYARQLQKDYADTRFYEAHRKDVDDIVARYEAWRAEQERRRLAELPDDSQERIDLYLSLKERADALARERKFGAAIAVFEPPPGALASAAWKRKIAELCGHYRGLAYKAFGEDAQRAQELLAQGKGQEALAVYQAATGYGIQAITEEAEARAGRVQMSLDATARVKPSVEQARNDLLVKLRRLWGQRTYDAALILAKATRDQADDPEVQQALAPLQRAAEHLARFRKAVADGAEKLKGKPFRVKGREATVVGLRGESLVLSVDGEEAEHKLGALTRDELLALARAGVDPDAAESRVMFGLFLMFDAQPDAASAKAELEAAQLAGSREAGELLAVLDTGTTPEVSRALIAALAAAEQGDYPAVREALDRALALKPGHTEALQLLDQTFAAALDRAREAAKRGDYAEARKHLDAAGVLKPKDPSVAALGKWLQEASRPIVVESFDADTLDRDWEAEEGTWLVVGGQLCCTAVGDGNPRVFLKRAQPKDFVAEFDILSTGKAEGVCLGLLFRYTPTRYLYFLLSDKDDRLLSGGATAWGRGPAKPCPNVICRRGKLKERLPVESKKAYHVKVCCIGGDFECYLDGELAFWGTDARPSAGRIGFCVHQADVRFDNLRIHPAAPLPEHGPGPARD